MIVPEAIRFEIEIHFFGDVRDHFHSERIGALEGEVRFIWRRVFSRMHNRISLGDNDSNERLPEQGAVGEFQLVDPDFI
ncbi:hypothetical protein ABTK82_19835, partial [Acinetobacter baumannii]